MKGWIRPVLRCSVATAVLALPLSPAAAQSCLEWRLRATSGPSPRGEYGLAYDARRSMTVLVGGAQNLGFDSVFRETWEWDGKAWSLRSTAGPTQRCDHAMGYDSTRQVVTSFGGYDGTFLRDTWTWDGSTWLQKSNTGPAARADSFMAFEATDGAMILFGGLTGTGVVGDTWRWNGTVWNVLAPATIPSARWIQRTAYDAARDEIVFLGGLGGSAVLGDMWAWTGTTWAPRTPATLPPARYGNAIAYDSDRQVVLLFGGQTGVAFGVGPLGDTWEWNGTDWVALPVSGPSARTFVKMAYDQRRRKLVLFGGHDGAQFVGDTWELGSDLDIATDPTSLGVAPGTPAQLHVVASGTGPFTYQWRKEGAPLADGGRISGATTDTLVIDPAEAGDSGKYSVVVSNGCGPVTSQEATLLVAVVPGEVPQMLPTYNRATGMVEVAYTPACGASDHTIHWGPLALVRLYTYTGSVCGLGASGSASFNPGASSVFFLMSGKEGSFEGSYGENGQGAERPADTRAVPCTVPKNTNATCE